MDTDNETPSTEQSARPPRPRRSRRTRRNTTTRRPRLNMIQATRAIYIDFENIPGEPPTLLGYAHDGQWTIAILDSQLADAASWGIPRGRVLAATADEMLTTIRELAETEQRTICAWSQHDLRIIRRIYADQPETLQWWEANLVNIRRQAMSFVRRHRYPVTPIVNRRTGRASTGHQAVIMAALGIDVPAEYGRGVAARGITALRNFLAEHGSLQDVDDDTKNQWTATLLHNRYDCFGMAAIMCPVTRGPGETLLASRWVMDPHQDYRYTEILHLEQDPPVGWHVDEFNAAWRGASFFYGVGYTDQGWAITEHRDVGTLDAWVAAIEIRPDLWSACIRAEMENIAMGLVPTYGWRTWNQY